jgi:MATE family, multidrug efflux pump
LAALSLPVVLSLVAEPITGLVDTAFVARLGSAPLAALGVGTVLLSSALWVFNFLGIGTQTEVAQALGAGDRARGRDACGVAVVLAAALGVALAAIAALLLPWLVAAMGAEGETAAAARTYLGIRLLGGPPMLVTMAALGGLRGLHDMRTPLWIAVGTNAANVVLDALLIFGAGPIPALGVAGAAWATVASQWGGGVAVLAAVRGRLGRPRRVDLRAARALLVVGRDLFLRTGLLIAFLLLATRAATRIGSDAGAAHQAIRQVWVTTAFVLDAYAAVAQSLVGTALGSRRRDLARRAASVATHWSLGSGVALAVAMIAGEKWVAEALVPETARSVFAEAWRVAALAQPINALSFVTDGIHWGTRDYRYLRNAMALSTGLGAAALLGSEWSGHQSLLSVWIVTVGWIALRAVFGVGRVWPGWGRSPLREPLAFASSGRGEG